MSEEPVAPTEGEQAEPRAEAPPPGQPSSPPSLLERLATPEPKRPLWSYFLTPVAVILAGAIIAGAIWYTDDEEAPLAAAPDGDGSGSQTTLPTVGGSSELQNLRGLMGEYAESLEMDADVFDACLLGEGVGNLINEHVERGTALGVNGTPTFFINNKRVVGAQPMEIFQEVIDKELEGSPVAIEEYSEAVQALAASGRFAIIAEPVDLSGAQFEGNPEAPVVVAEFSDFQCPFCQRWNQENLGWLRPRLGDEIALAFLHFPIPQLHPNAPYASVAAICAAEQGKFWEMHDLLFARQQEWQSLPVQ